MELELINLGKNYGEVRALDQVSYTFTHGIYGILGANGAGKSTLFNLLTDNIKRQEGKILCDGKEILEMGSTYRKIIGYMPQQQGFYENMSAISYMKYVAYLKGMRSKEFKAQAQELLAIVNLEGAKYKKVGGLSGGMRQRLLIACTLLDNPEILILDEPTAGLDPKERVELRNFIEKLSKNKIILIATHVVSDVENIADEIIIMKAGRIVAQGSTDALIESYNADCLEKVYMEIFKD